MSSRPDRARGHLGGSRGGVRGEPGGRTDHAEPMAAILDQLVQGRPLSSGLSLGRLARRWPEVVGERLAAECVPFRMEGPVLLVRASSAAWAVQVRFLADEVARRANEVLGTDAVRTVSVLVEGGR